MRDYIRCIEMKMFSLMLTLPQHNKLNIHWKDTGLPKSEIVRRALDEYFKPNGKAEKDILKTGVKHAEGNDGIGSTERKEVL